MSKLEQFDVVILGGGQDPPRLSHGDATTDVTYPVVRIVPPEVAIRRTVAGHGMAAESIQSMRNSP